MRGQSSPVCVSEARCSPIRHHRTRQSRKADTYPYQWRAKLRYLGLVLIPHSARNIICTIRLEQNHVAISAPCAVVSKPIAPTRCRQMKSLCASQTEAQRLISKHANGYPLWVIGETTASRWENLVEKFSLLYEVDISPSARQWRKKRGQCCSHLVGAALPNGKIRWALLVTSHGAGEVKQREKLQDAREDRLIWGDYALIQSTRSSAVGGGTHWSWFLTPQAERREANYLTGLAQAAGSSRQSYRLEAFTGTLLNRPLHAGVRQQVAKMLRRAQKVWAKHSNGLPWPGPDPASLPHLGAYRSSAVTLQIHDPSSASP